MTRGFLMLTALLLVASMGVAQTTVIPQVADGNGWQTMFVVTNITANADTFSIAFFQQQPDNSTKPWSLALLETSSTQNVNLAGGGTMILHTTGTGATTVQGFAQITADAGIVAYAVFTETVPGRQNQSGTSNAMAPSPRVLIPFNNTSGLVTSIGIANTASTQATIYVLIQRADGTITTPLPLVIPANGHGAFTTSSQFAETANASGLIELYPLTGNFAALALLFNPSGAFTTAPVYPQATETPIIGAGSYNGGPTGGGGGIYNY
jgi:hypothetical protein